ncbi:MAG: DUF547 domain-containing protein [Desulfobacteraceae bacterium]|nr:DUF547 domain-containing protein [Desulfobacteraceae bacterium]
MILTREVLFAGVACFLITGLVTGSRAAQEVDNRIYAELLGKYVKNGLVNYQGFKNEEAKLDQYLKVLESTDTKALSLDEQFAFYINAYNAWTIKLILTGYPGVKSIKDLGSFFSGPWKKKICRIDGEVISLDQIEHEILRSTFKDPRVHFTINCAARSCPPLRSDPYQGAILDQQLNEMASAFINDPSRNRLERNTLYVSKIFDWFEEDFNGDVIGFILKYAKGGLKKGLESNKGDTVIKYLDYDWSLNAK